MEADSLMALSGLSTGAKRSWTMIFGGEFLLWLQAVIALWVVSGRSRILSSAGFANARRSGFENFGGSVNCRWSEWLNASVAEIHPCGWLSLAVYEFPGSIGSEVNE
ncbi:hypothetical protein DL98DRAFT_14588 [Cadophora sp. DSE1049]|jgi:hypothetical protein|nr:hypothetical protein DL98DRAFT_14588 [Cadophora sp. DSE1049]